MGICGAKSTKRFQEVAHCHRFQLNVLSVPVSPLSLKSQNRHGGRKVAGPLHDFRNSLIAFVMSYVRLTGR